MFLCFWHIIGAESTSQTRSRGETNCQIAVTNSTISGRFVDVGYFEGGLEWCRDVHVEVVVMETVVGNIFLSDLDDDDTDNVDVQDSISSPD